MVFNPTGLRDAHGIYTSGTDIEDGPVEGGVPEGKAWFDLFAKLDLGISSLVNEASDRRRQSQAALRHLPRNIPLIQASTPGANVTDIKDFGGPQPGREWIVRLLSAFASPLAANVSIVTWYVGQVMPGPAAGMLPVSMARWQFPSVPGLEKFTSDVIRINAGERLIAGLTGIPASSNIVLGATVDDQLLYDVSRGTT